MKDSTAWTLLKSLLWVGVIFALLALVLGCNVQVEREPIVVSGYSHCIPTPQQTILCEITLKEQVDE